MRVLAAVLDEAQLQSRLPISESLSSIADYQFMQLQRLGVDLRLGQRASAMDVLATQPQAVVLATGATMVWPQALPTRLRDDGWVQDLREVVVDLLKRPGKQAGVAVLYDLDQTAGTYAAAEWLKDKFERVVILCGRESVAQDVPLVVRQRIQRRCAERGIEILTQVEPVWTELMEEEGRLAYRSIFGDTLRYIDQVALITYATPRKPVVDLWGPLRDSGVPVHRIGDCLLARDPMAATAEGHAIGMAL